MYKLYYNQLDNVFPVEYVLDEILEVIEKAKSLYSGKECYLTLFSHKDGVFISNNIRTVTDNIINTMYNNTVFIYEYENLEEIKEILSNYFD